MATKEKRWVDQQGLEEQLVRDTPVTDLLYVVYVRICESNEIEFSSLRIITRVMGVLQHEILQRVAKNYLNGRS